jgi:hypothetical protein
VKDKLLLRIPTTLTLARIGQMKAEVFRAKLFPFPVGVAAG